MKTFFCITVGIIMFLVTASAQSIRVGINAGATASFMKSRYQGIKEETDGTQKFGVTAGVMADVKLTGNLYFTPLLNFTQKGAIYRYTDYVSRGERTLNYAELLLNVLYGVPAANGRFSIGLGPGISYGINGKYKEKVNYGTTTEKGNIEFGNSEKEDYKPLDFGGTIMTAYEFSSGISLALNYYLGVSNLVNSDVGGNSAKNSYIGLRVGYFLSQLPKKIK